MRVFFCSRTSQSIIIILYFVDSIEIMVSLSLLRETNMVPPLNVFAV